MARIEFSAKTRDQAHDRAQGRCEWIETGFRCEAILGPGNCEYDHILAWAVSRDSTLANCQCLCRAHHGLKTARDDAPWIAKTRRQRQAHNGAKVPTSTIPSRGFAEPAPKNRALTKQANGVPAIRRLYADAEE